MIGLHKLVHIPLIGQFNDISNTTVSAKFLISKIKKESQLTESTIKNSVYFPDIAQRYQNFSKENLLTLTYTDAFVVFCNSFRPVGSSKISYSFFVRNY